MPGRAAKGVPTTLWKAIPIRIARIIGLKVAIPGIDRARNAATAIAAVRAMPGSGARADRKSDRAGTAGAEEGAWKWSAADVIGVAPVAQPEYRRSQYINPTDRQY